MQRPYFDWLKSEVIDAGLCTRCGTCVGVCPKGVLGIDNDLGDCLPQRDGTCEDCDGECYAGCSGKYVDFPALHHVLHGRQPESFLLGNYRDLWIAHATDERIRRQGGSGGAVTAMLKYLFDTGRIEGAYVLAMAPDRPYMSKPVVARNYEEAQAASQSKYCVNAYNVLLGDMPGNGDLAYVGLPCHVHSIRKLQQAGHAAARRFRYVLGSYCGNILHFSSVRSFLAKHGVTDLAEVKSLAYRAGEWPGNMRVEFKCGRVISMPKFHANYLIPFHIMKRCLLCTDLANEFADVSGGDAWAPVYEEQGKGFSMLVVRTETGKQLADEMIREGRIEVVPINYEDTIAMHSHGLDLKKRGAFLRIQRRRIGRKPVPHYGFTLGAKVPLARRIMEVVMGAILRICRTPLARELIQYVPDRLIGIGFKLARERWKSATRATKRTGLGTIRFRISPPGRQASTDRLRLGQEPLAPLYGEAKPSR